MHWRFSMECHLHRCKRISLAAFLQNSAGEFAAGAFCGSSVCYCVESAVSVSMCTRIKPTHQIQTPDRLQFDNERLRCSLAVAARHITA